VLSTLGAPVVAGPAAAGLLATTSSSNKQVEAAVQAKPSHHPQLQQQCDRQAAQDVGQPPLPAAAAAGQVPASKGAETKATKPVSADVTTRCCTSKAKVCLLLKGGGGVAPGLASSMLCTSDPPGCGVKPLGKKQHCMLWAAATSSAP
jgi:hypothetical protein